MSDSIKLAVIAALILTFSLTERRTCAEENAKTEEQIIALIGQLRESNEQNRETIISAFKRFVEVAFSTAVQEELITVFVDSKLSAETRVAAMTLLLEDEKLEELFFVIMGKSKSRLKPFGSIEKAMSTIASNRLEPLLVRQMALAWFTRVSFSHALDPETITACVELVKGRSEISDLRAYGIIMLSVAGTNSSEIFAFLCELIADHEEDAELRSQAMLHLYASAYFFPNRCEPLLALYLDIANDKEDSIDIRVNSLHSFDRLAYHMVIHCIEIDDLSQRHPQSLLDMINDTQLDPQIRKAAGSAFYWIPPVDNSLLPQLMALLKTGEPFEFEMAIKAISDIGPDAAPAIRLLLDLGGDYDTSQDVREAVFEALMHIAAD